jgi:hypothetical protein
MTTKRTVSTDELYREGRSFPRGQNRDVGSRYRVECEPSLEPKQGEAWNRNTVQDAENKHDDRSSPRGYHNDVADDWRRGGGKGGATDKPGFDFGASYRRANKGDDWNSTTQADKVSFVRPEPVGPNAKQMRKG